MTKEEIYNAYLGDLTPEEYKSADRFAKEFSKYFEKKLEKIEKDKLNG